MQHNILQLKNPLWQLFHWITTGTKGFLVIGFLLCLTACRPSTVAETRRYSLSGEIKSINAPSHRLTITHEAVAGYMEAMTMDYAVNKETDFKPLKPGDRIQATLILRNDESWLEDVVINPTAVDAPGEKPDEQMAVEKNAGASKKALSTRATKPPGKPAASKPTSTGDAASSNRHEDHTAHSH
ncbi:MAG: copper-binding protein [Acidobacteriota bacterium]